VPAISVITPCYRGEAYLPAFFDALAAQTVLSDLELVLVHNQPSPKELGLVRHYIRHHPGSVVHIVVDETNARRFDDRPGDWALETVAQSMNRALQHASGDYVALWNVDDIRTADSLERELALLDQNPSVALTYGDMIIARRHGETEGTYISTPDYSREEFMRSCHGAFQMWRKTVHDVAGLFDEQLRSGADFDLWIRVAANYTMKKTPGLLGYYLNAGSGLSTRKGGLQPTERTVIQLRYGILDKLDYRYLKGARRYQVGELRFAGAWRPVANFVPSYNSHMASSESLRPVGLRRYRRQRLEETAVACWRRPRRAAGQVLRRLGLRRRSEDAE
jgi:hypothetical protein